MTSLQNAMLTQPPMALYVHFPWCVRKCPYCDFNSHAVSGELPVKAYIAALIRDLAFEADHLAHRPIQSVFFGGGTPSLFPPDAIARFLDAATRSVTFVDDAEITLEVNPGASEHGLFAGYRRSGVNRLSIGVQSFQDAHLQRLGRIHSSADADRAIRRAQDAGLSNLNIDVMYALPGQSVSQAEDDIAHACALAPSHISYYQLTLEPNTYFFVHPPKQLPDEDLAWEIQQRGQALLHRAGFQHYEVSAYRLGEQHCKHNLNYWQFGDYVGIGAGAHGKYTDMTDATIMRRWKQRQPQAYLQNAGTPQAIGGEETISVTRRPFEFMLNALRLCHGFPLSLFTQRTGLSQTAIARPLNAAVERGWLCIDTDQWVSPSPLGQRFTNDIITLFLP